MRRCRCSGVAACSILHDHRVLGACTHDPGAADVAVFKAPPFAGAGRCSGSASRTATGSDLYVIAKHGLAGVALGLAVIVVTGVPPILADKCLGRSNGTAGLHKDERPALIGDRNLRAARGSATTIRHAPEGSGCTSSANSTGLPGHPVERPSLPMQRCRPGGPTSLSEETHVLSRRDRATRISHGG